MNSWIVGNHPIGHYLSGNFAQPEIVKVQPHPLVPTSTEFEQEEFGEKVFFMKGRIMAGQADLSKNEYGDKDFQWLAREEVQERVGKNYWNAIRTMLTDR
jgi:large subunit ribosomal protein L46